MGIFPASRHSSLLHTLASAPRGLKHIQGSTLGDQRRWPMSLAPSCERRSCRLYATECPRSRKICWQVFTGIYAMPTTETIRGNWNEISRQCGLEQECLSRPISRGSSPEIRGSRPKSRGSRPKTRGSRPKTRGSRPKTRGSRQGLGFQGLMA